jgi:hypothetical protein
MSKALVVEYKGHAIPLNLEKVDRSRLYGYVDTEVLDEQGRPCELATLNGDGHTVVGRGGVALAQLSPSGLWRSKADLKPVDPKGQVISPVKSSFEAPILLERQATVDDYLTHNIHLVYRLSPEAAADDLLAELRNGTIYTFPFSYRGGLEASTGFLLIGADGTLFLAVGSAPSFQFVGLKQPAAIAEEESTDEEEDSLDFGMM